MSSSIDDGFNSPHVRSSTLSPALLTRISSRPNFSLMKPAIFSTALALMRSPGCTCAVPPDFLICVATRQDAGGELICGTALGAAADILRSHHDLDSLAGDNARGQPCRQPIPGG